jgi:hypothetical protein
MHPIRNLALVLYLCAGAGPAFSQGSGFLSYSQFTRLAERYMQAAGPKNPAVAMARRFLTGDGVPQDYTEFAKYVSLAAESGEQWAQLVLGLAHYSGRGVQSDLVRCYFWTTLAASGPDPRLRTMAKEQLYSISQYLSSGQRAAAQEMVRTWKPKETAEKNAELEPAGR